MKWLFYLWLLLTVLGAAVMGEYDVPTRNFGKFYGFNCVEGNCTPIYQFRVQAKGQSPHRIPGELPVCVVDGKDMVLGHCAGTDSLEEAVEERSEQ